MQSAAMPTPASDDIPRRVGMRPRNQVLDSATPAARFKRRKLSDVEDDDSSSGDGGSSQEDTGKLLLTPHKRPLLPS